MEYFRRLLGALQETLDYVSSFTTYLLGDETHPGAEESRRTRELKHRSSRHDLEVETAAHSGNVSPQGYLDAFERPPPTEVTSFNQEIRVASEAVVIGAQAAEAIPESSKSVGQEATGQKLSESPQFLADAPKPIPTATVIGNDRQKDLEELESIPGLHPWELEGATLMEGIQQEGLEEIGLDLGSSPHWESERPLAEGNREGEQNGEGGTDPAQQRELEMTDQQTDWDLQASGLKEAAWTEETEHGSLKELAKMAEIQHLEEEEEKESAVEKEWDQQRGTYEGFQQAVLERAETEANLEEALEEEPGKTLMTFEVQEWDPKWVAEEGNSHQSGLEETKDPEDHQHCELERTLRNEAQAEDKQRDEQMDGVWESISERLVEEKDLEEVLEKTDTRGVPPWESEKSLQESTGSRASLDMYLFGGEQIVGEPEKLTEELEDVAAEVVLEEAETVGYQQREPERTERSLQQEPMRSRASPDICLYAGGEQIVGEPGKPEDAVEVVMLEDEKTSGHQPWEPEGTETKLHEDTYLFGEKLIVEEPKKLTEEQVVEVVLEEAETGRHQPWELEVTKNSLHEEPMGSRGSLDTNFFDGEQTEHEPEKTIEEVAVIMQEEAEAGGPQLWEPEEGLHEEPKGCNASLNMCLVSGEQVVGESEKLTEEQETAAVIELEDAETGGEQPWEPEGPEKRLHEEPMGSRTPLNACLFDGKQTVGEPEDQTEEKELVRIVLEEAEAGEGQPWEPKGPERCLHEELTESQASPQGCLFAGPRTFPDEVLPLDTSAQKERVMLRRKSSIRRAPSLKKPKLPTETQPPSANLAEAVPSPLQAPRQSNPRLSGFGPMHPNMMAELQMRLRRPQ